MSRPVRRMVIALAAMLGVVATVALGRWQLDRAAQKEALGHDIAVQSSQSPLSVADVLATPDRTSLQHRPIKLVGRWLREHTVYLDNRQMHGKVGFYVVTPLQLADSSAVVMVQRGWAPRNFEDRAALPVVQTAAGMVELQGRMAPPPAKLYEPGKSVHGPIRQNLDLAQFQEELGMPLWQDVSVVQTGAASEGLLRDWPEVNLGVDKHYGYAAQWFALTALIFGLYVWFQLRPLVFNSKDIDVPRQSE